MPLDFYSTKKLVRGLGLPVQAIHYCVNNCMIYWGDDSDLNSCKKCGHARYKEKVRRSENRLYIRKLKVPYKKVHYFPITPRLQRLYASTSTTNEMRWHSEHHMEDGKMCHPSDALLGNILMGVSLIFHLKFEMLGWVYLLMVFSRLVNLDSNILCGLWW